MPSKPTIKNSTNKEPTRDQLLPTYTNWKPALKASRYKDRIPGSACGVHHLASENASHSCWWNDRKLLPGPQLLSLESLFNRCWLWKSIPVYNLNASFQCCGLSVGWALLRSKVIETKLFSPQSFAWSGPVNQKMTFCRTQNACLSCPLKHLLIWS